MISDIRSVVSRASDRMPLLRKRRDAYEASTSITGSRINELVSLFDAACYLEIGLLYGDTFVSVQAHRKVGVDPLPRFRLRNIPPGCPVTICATTSDRFFDDYQGTAFDVILLDGFHSFDQTWRDLANSLHHVNSSRSPVWIVDDVIPDNDFEAVPDYKESKKAFRRAGLRPGLWRGDVWKTLFAMHVTDGFEFRVFGSQALAWLAPECSTPVLPTPSMMENIRRTSWPTARKRIELDFPSHSWDSALEAYRQSRRYERT